MKTIHHSVALKGAPRVVETRRSRYRDVTISIDGQPALYFPNKKALKQGGAVHLNNGMVLEAQFVSASFNPGAMGTQIRLNGIPMSTSAGGTHRRLKAMGQNALLFEIFSALPAIILILTGLQMNDSGKLWVGLVLLLLFGVFLWMHVAMAKGNRSMARVFLILATIVSPIGLITILACVQAWLVFPKEDLTVREHWLEQQVPPKGLAPASPQMTLWELHGQMAQQHQAAMQQAQGGYVVPQDKV